MKCVKYLSYAMGMPNTMQILTRNKRRSRTTKNDASDLSLEQGPNSKRKTFLGGKFFSAKINRMTAGLTTAALVSSTMFGATGSVLVGSIPLLSLKILAACESSLEASSFLRSALPAMLRTYLSWRSFAACA